MKIENKHILAAVAVIFMAATWLDNDFSALQSLNPVDFLPVLIITAVIFLAKTGAVSAVLIGLKKLWEHLRKK